MSNTTPHHTKAQLIIVRHGESQWNQENRFTGWVDVDLSEKGHREAKEAGRLIREAGLVFDVAFTSYLKRAIRTLWHTLENSDRMFVPVHTAWELNERHYGALSGLNKTETAEKYGEAQVKIWRRSYSTRPPLMADDDKTNPAAEARYKNARPLVLGESLADTVLRVSQYFEKNIAPVMQSGLRPLIVAHGNSLRALIKYLEGVSEDEILELNIPTGVPLFYELQWQNNTWKPVSKKYLGNAADIAARQQAVAMQGSKT